MFWTEFILLSKRETSNNVTFMVKGYQVHFIVEKELFRNGHDSDPQCL